MTVIVCYNLIILYDNYSEFGLMYYFVIVLYLYLLVNLSIVFAFVLFVYL